MTDLILRFRKSFVSAVFDLSFKVWWKYAVVSIIQGIVVLMAAIPLLLSLFNWSELFALIENPQSLEEQIEADPESIFSFLGQDPDYAQLAVGISIFMIVALIAQAWLMNCYFKLNQAQIETGKSDLGLVLSRSFDSKILALIGSSLVLNFVFLLLGAGGFALGALVHWSVAVFAGLLVFVFMFRFVLIFPAQIHGDLSIGDALGASVRLMTWRRALILIGACILVGIVLMFSFFVLGIVSFVIMLIPLLGPIVYYLMNFVLSGFLNALAFGSMSGIWYRYNDAPDHTADDIHQHLISE